ncbi:2,3-diketo-L-gulonate TRAP transporter large permease protein [Gammaproteobacteria bacterium]|nr:2,3-diketo-L-gulonate TRAP transporter large permease protein [Gammaproteobacteria bacterium]
MELLLFTSILICTMAIGLPVAFALIVAAIALMTFMGMNDPILVIENMWEGANSFPLMAVPFFMLAGEAMNAGGITKRIIAMSISWFGHIRGGLGYVTIIAAVIMASLSGSAVADTAALAAVLIPLMRGAGYDVHRVGGLIASGGIIAPIIPPSIGMILYGVSGQVSITKLFMAGIIPGLMMGFGLMLTWWYLAKKEDVKVLPKASMKERLKHTGHSFWAILLPIVVIGGLRLGFFTPTEAAVMAAVYSLLVGIFIYREIKLSMLYSLFFNAAKTTAVIMFLVGAASISAWLITAANMPAQLAVLLKPVIGHPRLLVLCLVLLVLVIGMAMDFTPNVLILTPVIIPILRQGGVDPVYFGVLFIMANAIGLITPPVGTVLNVICGVGNLSMTKLVSKISPFLVCYLIVLGLLILFPSIMVIPK